MGRKKKLSISSEQVLEELAAIGFARATDYLTVEKEQLRVMDTQSLTPKQSAAIAAMETTSGGVRLKFYDKLKALELLGKYLQLFGGEPPEDKEQSNLLEAIVKATEGRVDTSDIRELQPAAAAGHDLVEPGKSPGL